MAENISETLSLVRDFKDVLSMHKFLNNLDIYPEDPTFLSFIKDMLVCSVDDIDFDKLKKLKGPQTCHQYEILLENISGLLASSKTNYVQVFGYKASAQTVLCQVFNLTNRILISNPFEYMLSLIGDQLMLYLLKNLLTFKIFEKRFYLQLCGPIIIDFYNRQELPQMNAAAQSWFQSYMNRKNNKILEGKKEFRSRINRNLIFFCPHFNRNPSLFKSHILEKTKEVNDPALEAFIDAIFPKEKPSKSNQKQLKPILQKVFINYKSIKFNALMRRHCSLPPDFLILKKKVEHSCHNNNKKVKEEIADLFNSLFDNHIAYDNVYLLLKDIVKKVFPRELLGEENFKILNLKVKKFVQMKRFETFLIQDLVSDFNALSLPWLTTKWSKKWAAAIKVKSHAIIEQLIIWIFNEFIINFVRANFYVTERHGESNKIFYYRKALWKLVSKLAIKNFEDRNLVAVKPDQQSQVEHNYEYPISKLRILPKKDSFRPIMTFFRKPNLKVANFRARKMTMNQLLTDSHIVLRTLKDKLGQDFGFAVFDNFQIFKRYQEFSTKWHSLGKPKLYFVTMDIKKCYDSINTQVLLQFLKETTLLSYLKHDEYLICKYGALFRNKNQISQTDKQFPLSSYFNYKERVAALRLDEMYDLEKHFKEITDDPRKAILFDLVQRKIVYKHQILKHLKYICEHHVVLTFSKLIQYENKFYVQKRGIPQGLNISAIISSFYYATLEERYLGFLREDPKDEANLLMRLTDDYLFVTTNLQQANRVIEALLKCAKDNNFEINEEKVKTNFPFSMKNGVINPAGQTQILTDCKASLKWCGKIINTENFEIVPGFEIEETKMYYSVNVKLTTQNVTEFLKNKLKSFLLNHSHFFINPIINSEETIQKILRLFVKVFLLIKDGLLISKATIMKIYAFFEEYRTTRKPEDFQESILRMTKYGLEDYVHNCLKVKGLERTVEQEVIYLKICYEEFLDFFLKKRSNYFKYTNKLKKCLKYVEKNCQNKRRIQAVRMDLEN